MTQENNTKPRVECSSSVLKETFRVKHSIAAESLKAEVSKNDRLLREDLMVCVG